MTHLLFPLFFVEILVRWCIGQSEIPGGGNGNLQNLRVVASPREENIPFIPSRTALRGFWGGRIISRADILVLLVASSSRLAGDSPSTGLIPF